MSFFIHCNFVARVSHDTTQADSAGARPLWQAGMGTQQKLGWGNKQAYRVIHQPVTVVSQCGAGAWLYGWLADISADLREAVAHLRRVRDDALNKSTVSLLYDSHSKLATNSQPPRIVVVLYV